MIAQAGQTIRRFTEEVYFALKLPAPETRRDYLFTLDVFERWAGGSPAIKIVTPEYLGKYLTWLQEQGRSPGTALKHRRIIRAVLALAKRKRLTRIDLDEIPRPKRTKLQPQAWSPEEFERLVMAAMRTPGRVGPWPTGLWLPALCLTCWATDWRISCVMRLRVADVSLADRWAKSIESKTREERFCSLHPQCVEALARIWGPRKEVFGDWPHDRKSRQWARLNELLAKCIALAGVPDIGRFHAIRKTATTIVADRAGLEAAAGFAGHPSSNTTRDHYIDRTKLTNARAEPPLPRLRLAPPSRQMLLFE